MAYLFKLSSRFIVVLKAPELQRLPVTVEVLRVEVMIVGVISVRVMTVGVLSVGVMTLFRLPNLSSRLGYGN
jgi:hypothetical protein